MIYSKGCIIFRWVERCTQNAHDSNICVLDIARKVNFSGNLLQHKFFVTKITIQS